jgi:hypothetical protein
MKKSVIPIICLVFSILLFACAKDDGGKPNDTQLIVTPTPSKTVDATETVTEEPDTPSPTQEQTATPTPNPTSTPTQIPTPTPTPTPTAAPVEFENSVTYASLSYGGIDSLGREISLEGQVPAKRDGRYVGIFYFLWIGAHGTSGPYDNTKIVETWPDALTNEARWGPLYAHHFWGEPLFGYYRSSDPWVMRKHVQMLTDAGIDFLVFDTTNANGNPSSGPFTSNGGNNNTYISAALDLLKILDEYYKKGHDVPKVAFYTNSNSSRAMTVIYNEVYKAHSEYSHLWFNWDGKPMIIGKSNEASQEVKNFFRIKESQWPNEGKKPDGFPWMEFSRLLQPSAIYGLNGRKEVMNVSIAQHNVTVRMSAAAWYGGKDRTRSFHNGKLDTSENAVLCGYNFAEQWEFAIQNDPEIVFVTGWNEWVAQRQKPVGNEIAVFVDCASMEASRDAEPMKGGYGDNYYMQLIEYVKRYKGTEPNIETDSNRTIKINKDFSQWNDVKAYYKDYTNDIVNRNHPGFGSTVYRNTTGRNDIYEMKVCSDKDNIYFLVTCANDITQPSGSNWMNLYIRTQNKSNNTWNGYDFVLNRTAPSKDKAILEKCSQKGEFSWTKVAEVSYSMYKKYMMVAIPKSALGISTDKFAIQFKWTDNCTPGDIFSFYTDGDAAPIGRLNYVYQTG